MKQYLTILIVVCVLLAATSVRAEDKLSISDQINMLTSDEETMIKTIKVFIFRKYSMGALGDAWDLLDFEELYDYLKIKIKNNFVDIKLVDSEAGYGEKYVLTEMGFITIVITALDTDCGAFYTVDGYIRSTVPYTECRIKYDILDEMGVTSKENFSYKVKDIIESGIEDFAILFYKVRLEL